MLRTAILLALLALVAASASSPFDQREAPLVDLDLDVSDDALLEETLNSLPKDEFETAREDLAASEKAESDNTIAMMDAGRSFGVLKCDAQIEALASENRKNRPVILRELSMIKTIQASLLKLINTKEETQTDVQLSEAAKARRQYTETDEIKKLMGELDQKLRDNLRAQRKALLDCVHTCMAVCRDRHHKHRMELLEARELRRAARRHYHALEKLYYKLKAEYEVLLAEYIELKRITAIKIARIHKEMHHLGILQGQMAKYLSRPTDEQATTELEVEGDSPFAKALADLSPRHATLSAEIIANIATLKPNAHLTAAERKTRAGRIKLLLDELMQKLKDEKAELLRILELKRLQVVAKHKEMMEAKKAMDLYRPVLGHRKAVVKELVALVKEGDERCTAIEQSKYLTKTADGKDETVEERRANADAADAAHARKMSQKTRHKDTVAKETASEIKDKATNAAHMIRHEAETKKMENPPKNQKV